MKNKFLMIVFLSMFCIATPAYAIVDVVATVQSVLEKVKEVKDVFELVNNVGKADEELLKDKKLSVSVKNLEDLLGKPFSKDEEK